MFDPGERVPSLDQDQNALVPINGHPYTPKLMKYPPRPLCPLLALSIIASPLACADPGRSGQTAMVIGLMSDDMNIVLERLHITTAVAGKPATDETLDHLEHGDGFGPPPWWPKEIRLEPGEGGDDAEVSVQIEGYLNQNQFPESQFPGVDLWPGLSPDDPDFSTKRLLIRRLARKRFIPGQDSLLRITLENKCSRVIFGPYLEGPVCDPPMTCIGGACRPDDADKLEPYVPNWATGAPDDCKPAGATSPVLELGTGETSFLPIADGQTLSLVTGPQGGHHLWISLRMKGIQQVGSITTITSVQPGTNLAGPATKFAMAFSPETDGFCKLDGLRYQLDVTGDIASFLGKPLDIMAAVTPPSGPSASAVAHVVVDATVQ